MTSFVSGISVTCFAASYAVAWALEVSRLFFRSGVRGAVMIGFAAAGLIAQTLYLGYRVSQAPAAGLSSNFDWCLLAAWLLMMGYFYLTYYHPRAVIGLFLLPLVLALVGGAALFADREPLATEPASRAWGAIHGIFLLFGTVAVMGGFVAGVMYLLQANRLKRKLPPSSGMRYPSLEWLQKVNSRVIPISAILVGVGFVAGIILKLIGDRRGEELPWTDPVVWSSGAMLAWLLTAAMFNAVYKPARQGRKVAYLTVVSFAFLVISLGVLLLVNNEHGGGKGERRPGRTNSQSAIEPSSSIVLAASAGEVRP